MSLQYLLDGYNILHQLPTSDHQKFDEVRQQLLRMLEIQRPQGSLRNQLTIVFDGHPGMFHHAGNVSVKIIFSLDESADERIKKIVSGQGNKRNIIVVTDDRDVQYAVRALGAQVMDVQSFLGRVSKGQSSSSDKSSASSKSEQNKNLSKTLEFEITSEFAKIWLKKQGKEK